MEDGYELNWDFEEEAWNEEALDRLYDQYCTYMQDLSSDCGRPIQIRSRGAFPGWFFELSSQVRAHFVRNWRMGYAAVIAEGRRQVEQYLKKRDELDLE